MDFPNLAQAAQELGSWNPRLETTRGTRARAVPVNGVVGSSTEMSVLVQLHRIYTKNWRMRFGYYAKIAGKRKCRRKR